MPELPEVETTRMGIAPHISGKTFTHVHIRQPKLRWPVVAHLAQILNGQSVTHVSRRAKYLLIHTHAGHLIIHLGMSGSLRIYEAGQCPPPQKHDHADFEFDDETTLRFHDPRRFGAILWFAGALEQHPLLQHLGPEPLTQAFNATYLQQALSKQKRAIKLALMDNAVVVGVGNIYANEALFHAAIAPTRAANHLQPQEYAALTSAIKNVLQRALAAGGSTLRDFVNSKGHSGYFQQQYTVYGRHNEPCPRCHALIHKIILGQRSSFYCSQCQY